MRAPSILLTAAMLLVLGATSGVQAAPWTYTLDSDFGPLTLSVDRATGSVIGSYPKFQGRIDGVLGPDGVSIHGTWFQPNADRRCDDSNFGTYYWGYVDFVLPPRPGTGAMLSGSWGYCHAAMTEPWHGTFR